MKYQMQTKRVGNEIAINAPAMAPEVKDLKEVAAVIIATSSLEFIDGYLVNDKGGYFSPFGHGNGVKDPARIATNAQIDKSLCRGITMTKVLIENNQVPTRNCDRTNEVDLKVRPELSNVYHDGYTNDRIISHLAFLSGKGNGKNSLQKRLLNVLPEAGIEQINEIAQMIHHAAAPLAAQAERVDNADHGTRKHAIQDYVNGGKYGVEFDSISAIR